MQEEFTVSRLSALIKRSLELNFGTVKLTAEVSALKIHFSGHAYFSLKDEDAVIDAVCRRSVFLKQNQKLENGARITCYGKVSSYPMQSKYQFIVEKFEQAGLGNLFKLLEERKRKLAGEGLFDSAHKKPIPKIPKVIGVITSPTGAVIQDILHRIRQRFPSKVLLWPVLVQGSEAAEQIEKALDGMNSLSQKNRPDVIIVARGGGSFEDLMPFNEEIVVRAVYRSEIPVISAVGHETDTTLIDYVSDLRAPTPTAAAEFAVPERIKLLYDLEKLFSQLTFAVQSHLEKNRLRLDSNKILGIESLLFEKSQRLDFCFERLVNAVFNIIRNKKMNLSELLLQKPECKINLDEIQNRLQFDFINHINNLKHRLNLAINTLDSCSYINILRKGFAFAETKNHQAIISAEQAKMQSQFLLTFSDGELTVSPEICQMNLSIK